MVRPIIKSVYMSLPEFNDRGDMPEGVHQATFDEVIERFGNGSSQRQLVTDRLRHIYKLAQRTGKKERFIIFGSYVTATTRAERC